jgi:hypothetical protein
MNIKDGIGNCKIRLRSVNYGKNRVPAIQERFKYFRRNVNHRGIVVAGKPGAADDVNDRGSVLLYRLKDIQSQGHSGLSSVDDVGCSLERHTLVRRLTRSCEAQKNPHGQES